MVYYGNQDWDIIYFFWGLLKLPHSKQDEKCLNMEAKSDKEVGALRAWHYKWVDSKINATASYFSVKCIN